MSVAARRSQGCRPSGRSGTAAFIRRHSSRISTSVSTSTPNDLCSWYSWNFAPRSLTNQTMAKPTVSSPTTRTAISQWSSLAGQPQVARVLNSAIPSALASGDQVEADGYRQPDLIAARELAGPDAEIGPGQHDLALRVCLPA